jgi:hypothetical protein
VTYELVYDVHTWTQTITNFSLKLFALELQDPILRDQIVTQILIAIHYRLKYIMSSHILLLSYALIYNITGIQV